MKQTIKKLLYEKNIASLGSNVIAAILGLLSFLLLTRSLSKIDFGDWVLYITLASFTDLLRFGLTRTALVRFITGAGDEEKKAFLGTSFKINILLVGLITIICWPVAFILSETGVEINNGYLLFLKWYPLLALVNLSWNNAMSLFQAEQRFMTMLIVQAINLLVFVVFLAINLIFLRLDLTVIVVFHMFTNLLSSVYCIAKKWDGLAYLKKSGKEFQRKLLDFGKFSMGTLIGSSLLKSADTFIIGLSPVLGSAGIAMYAIPLKLTDLLGIPLRAFTMTAYPKMAQMHKNGNLTELRKIFYSYTGVITLLFIPVAIIGYFLAAPLVLFLGGNEYKDSLPLLVSIFRIFTLYTLFLPYDRFTGVLLDSINKPKLNLYKVIVMAAANVIGDIIGVFVFNSLEVVAIVTIVFTVIGIWIGNHYLAKEIQLKIFPVFTEGILFFKNIKNVILNKDGTF
ncbi:MAG TPA: oligosaccharide flippase family protein [Draconibacterium sp.]|nr:oligosaccharide flippase family protein [Draconibacterium sp.]